MNLPDQWLETHSEPTTTERFDFGVHLKYVRYIASITKSLSATTSLQPCIGPEAVKELDHKMRLLERTTQSIREELRSIHDDADYAHACVAWLPAKVYYNLYHLLSIVEYMVTGDRNLLRVNHADCLHNLADRIGDGLITFNNPQLNRCYDKSVLEFRSRSGGVLSQAISDETMLGLIMKKIAKDRLADWQVRRKIDRRTAAGKKAYAKEVNKLRISIVDFFYSMRIRTNYKDMAFIDEVDPDLAMTYFVEYYEASDHFYSYFNELKNELIGRISFRAANRHRIP